MHTILALLAMAIAAPQPKPADGAAGLKAHFTVLQKAIRDGDTKRALALSKSLLGDEARLRKALEENVDKDVLARIVEMHRGYRALSDEKLALAFKAKPEQTEIQVHGATVKDIAKYAKGSVTFKEFPEGARDLAATILRPGLTFYEVEFLEPGKDTGLKFHLFYWDGQGWAMLGAAWRALKK
jgi:hypothetical protein